MPKVGAYPRSLRAARTVALLSIDGDDCDDGSLLMPLLDASALPVLALPVLLRVLEPLLSVTLGEVLDDVLGELLVLGDSLVLGDVVAPDEVLGEVLIPGEVLGLGDVLVLGELVVPGDVVSDGLVVDDCGCTGEVWAVVELLLSDGVVVVVVVVVVVSDGLPVVVDCGGVRVLCVVVAELELSVDWA